MIIQKKHANNPFEHGDLLALPYPGILQADTRPLSYKLLRRSENVIFKDYAYLAQIIFCHCDSLCNFLPSLYSETLFNILHLHLICCDLDLESIDIPYVLVSDSANSSLQIAPFGSWNQFKAIPGLVNTSNPSVISYDPVEEQIYWVAASETTKQQIARCDLNGMQEEALIGVGRPTSGKFRFLE